MLKRCMTIAVGIFLLVLPSVLMAGVGHKLATGTPVTNADKTITVPLELTNEDNLVAIDIPLKFSEGVTLKEVSFAGTRVDYFDLKAVNIKNDQRTVVIGLLPQVSPAYKPELSAGTGTVANLVFEVTDPNVSSVTFEAAQLENPHHSLLFIYRTHDEKGAPAQRRESPKFETSAVSLGGLDSDLPTVFSLGQNYPNPFNPSTEISFSIPLASSVELSIYNVLGQKVSTLLSGDLTAGSHTVTWNGTNDRGESVSSGVYFYRISADRFNETKKMMLLK